MRRTLCCTLIVLLLSLFAGARAQTSAPVSWEQFRSVYPYHFQCIAISEPIAGGQRLLIVSEPPPHITLKSFVAIDPAILANATTRHRKIGYDGWVKDIVVNIPPTTDVVVRQVIDRINYELFGTTYKAHTLRLPATRARDNLSTLDLRITTADIHRWLVSEQLAFGGPGDARVRPLSDLLRDGQEGVLRSSTHGLVAWILPKNGAYSQRQREARQFALDSDLIVGAIANAHHFAIIARERVISLLTLPPLRSETLLLLADVSSASLAQSYERNYILAGKYDGQRDWAPIYLSDALIDTEYGSLLNLTDQLLKSWSMAGKVKYIDFPYPPPSSYPFGEQPLARMPGVATAIRESGEGLTFNWNTHGAGYVDRIGELSVYGLNRTGALPISYLSGGSNDTKYEEDAYTWFASKTNDPNLARVVQYAAMYQIFHEFHAVPARPRVFPNRQPELGGLTRTVETALGDIFLNRCKSALSSSSGTYEQALKDLLADLTYCSYLERALGQGEESGFQLLARALTAATREDSDSALVDAVLRRPKSERRAYLNSLSEDERRRVNVLFTSYALAGDPSFRRALQATVPLARARDLYAAGTKRASAGWIRTSSVVVSWPIGEVAGGTGGHNLDAKIGRFVADPALKTGEVRVGMDGGERVIRYSPQDRHRLPDWLRDLAVVKDEPALMRRVSGAFKKPPAVPANRSMVAALGLDGRASEQRGLTKVLASVEEVADTLGWGETAVRTPAEELLWRRMRLDTNRLLNVERLDTGDYRVLDGASGQVFRAHSTTDVLDTVVASLRRAPGKPPTTLILAGFGEGDAINFRRNVESWIHREVSTNRRVAARRVADQGNALDKALGPLSQHGDLARARFGSWEVRDTVLPSGVKGSLYETTIEVPPRMGVLRSFFFKVRLFFRRVLGTHEELVTAELTIKNTLSSLRADATADDAAAALEAVLRPKFPDFDSVVIEIEGVVTAQRYPASRVDGQVSTNEPNE